MRSGSSFVRRCWRRHLRRTKAPCGRAVGGVKFVVDEDEVPCGRLESGDPDPALHVHPKAHPLRRAWALHTAAEQLFVATGQVLTERRAGPGDARRRRLRGVPGGQAQFTFRPRSSAYCCNFDQRYDIPG